MTNIEKIDVLDPSKLNEELYFQSLLEEAYHCNLLLESDIERIQFECLELLAYQSDQYNGGDSSSIRIEVAENIMKSNLYTMGIFLKSLFHIDDAIKVLKEAPICELYKKGAGQIEEKIKDTKHLYQKVIQNKIDIAYYTYNATIVDGIKGFFKLYNPEFDACEIHITADYPICNPIKNLVGIEFIQKYLESIYYENMFCQNFLSDDIHHLLCGIDENYDYLIFNIYEQVLTTAIGCRLAGLKGRGLNLSELTIEYLYRILSDKTSDEIRSMIFHAYCELKEEFSIKNSIQEQYVEKSLPKITSNICIGIKLKTLGRVFLVPEYPEEKPKVTFSLGEKMENERYRNIVEEVMQCRFLSDKIYIIKTEIQSFADLEDIFLDAELNREEITSVLNELELSEIAVLAKRHPLKEEIGAIDLKESEEYFRRCLHDHIASLSEEKQLWVRKAINMIAND